MRSRTALFALLLVAGSLALPLVAQAGIPFFGPIIEPNISNIATNSQYCPLGWGAVIVVINNIISLLITLAIVFVAPLMIAWAGFLLVVNPVNAGGKEEAKKILTNTVVGIVLALAGYMIVAALMAVLYDSREVGKTWTQLITSGGLDPCMEIAGSLNQAQQEAGAPTPGVAVAPGACPAPLSSLTDPSATQMEGGQTVIWTNTDPRLQACANKFIRDAGGGSVTSAYRPQSYQTHLWEIHDRWCTQGLKSNSDPVCSSLRDTVSQEVAKHGLSSCGSVAQNASNHGNPQGASIGVDISLTSGDYSGTQTLASQSCLTWANYPGDQWHYNLKSSCSCQ